MKICFWFIHYWTKWGEIEQETVTEYNDILFPRTKRITIERQIRTCFECNVKQIRYFYPMGKD